MNFKSTLICTALIGLYSLPVQAATWSKTSAATGSNCNVTTSSVVVAANTLGNTTGSNYTSNFISNAANSGGCLIANTDADASNATVTAWANTGSNGAWSAAKLTNQGGSGFGVNNEAYSQDGNEATSPEHALDNNGRNDAIMLAFAKSSTLNNVTMGWSQSDTDFSVLAWTGGAGAPAMGSLNPATNTRSMAGWTVVGNYARSGSGSFGINSGSLSNGDLSTSVVSSSYWLITAFNTAFGSATSSLDGGNDYFKLLSVSGSTANRVSEPGALALAGLGLFGAAIARRRRKQA